jgi:hypothetical protein
MLSFDDAFVMKEKYGLALAGGHWSWRRREEYY